jgi:hypothetical protein
MQDQQVDPADVELPGALLECVQRLVVPVVADPDLCLQEHVRGVEIGGVHRLADLPLVAVGRCSVDMPVSGGERRGYRRARLVRWRLKDPEAECRDLHAVVEDDGLHLMNLLGRSLAPLGTTARFGWASVRECHMSVMRLAT